MADNHNNDNLIDLEKLKKDPNLWSRLSVLKGDDDKMEHIFEGEENPFLKDGPAAMEKINKLAEQGKLFVRGYGRASHYQKIEKKGDELKMEEGQYVLKRGATWDPVGNVLLRASRAYFKWLGLDSIANWFDKRLKAREEKAKERNEERDKYKELSRKEKKELKKIQKKEEEIEKARKKLENLEKETEDARKEWNKLMGIDPEKDKGVQQPQQTQPPQVNQPQSTVQPNQPQQVIQNTIEATPPVTQTPTSQKSNLVQQSVIQQEFLGNQKTEQTVVKDDTDDIPEYVRNAAQIVENYTKERLVSNDPNRPDLIVEAAYQLPVNQPQEQAVSQNKEPAPRTPGADVKEAQPRLNPEDMPNPMENEMPEAARQDSNPRETDMDSPVNSLPGLEKDKVNAQERTKDQADLYDRLAAEKQEMDSVKNWQDRVANSLFSHEEARTTKENYEMLKGNKEAGDEFLAGAVCGMLSKNAASPDRDQKLVNDLLDGKPLGSQNDNRIRDGLAAYNDAIAKNTNGNSKPLENLIANSIRELSRQASQETTLSPRLAMIGRMIHNAVKIADDNKLSLPLDKDDWSIARGAATLSTLSQKYHKAKQHLSNEPMDISSSKGRRAVRDLLLGSAVEKMIQQDKRLGQTVTNTQKLMGTDLWSVDSLQTFTSGSSTRKGISQDQVQELLERPNSLKSLGISKHVADDLLQTSVSVMKEAEEKARKKELEAGREKEPEINPLQARV